MNFTAVTEYVEKVLRAEMGVPGCDLRIMQDHKVLLRYQSGVSDYAGRVPVSDRDLYFMYSCTKPMTCAAAMQLVEQGVIGLDDPVERYLPEFSNVFLLKNGKKVKPQNTMTVRHLFTMTAGLDYNRETEPILRTVRENPQAGTMEIVNAFAQSPLSFEPGERFQYSLCHDVLAAVVEAASGMRFSEYLKKNIWDPIGMTETGFRLPEEKKSRLCAQYEAECPGRMHVFPMENDFQLSDNYESGGAGLYCTAEDYSRFADAMACGGVGQTGARILRPETIDRMRTEQLRSFTVQSDFSCAAGPGYGYGLGVRTLIDRSEGQRSPIGEFGWDGAAGSYVMIDPENKISIFFAMHVRNWPALIGCGHAPIRDLTYEVLGL